jgi:hypothetical protein
MTDTQMSSEAAGPRAVDTKLEVVVIPVSDAERAERFYAGPGWRLDGDFATTGGSTTFDLDRLLGADDAKTSSRSPPVTAGYQSIVHTIVLSRWRPLCGSS